MSIRRRHMLAVLAGCILAGAGPVYAKRASKRDGDDHDDNDDDDFDHAEADRARRSGEIRPLEEILEEVQKQLPGEVVGVEFDQKHGLWVYEIKLLTSDGRYLELYIDAKSKQIIKIEGK